MENPNSSADEGAVTHEDITREIEDLKKTMDGLAQDITLASIRLDDIAKDLQNLHDQLLG